MLDTVSTLLEIKPNSALILDLALRPLTLEGLRTVAAWTSNYSEDTWLKSLFPLIRSEIAKMNVQGVSGDELEQEIVDLLTTVQESNICTTEVGLHQDLNLPMNCSL